MVLKSYNLQLFGYLYKMELRPFRADINATCILHKVSTEGRVLSVTYVYELSKLYLSNDILQRVCNSLNFHHVFQLLTVKD